MWARRAACASGSTRTSRTRGACTRGPPRWCVGGRRRLGHGHHRGRGAAARVLLDQGVRPPVQRALPRRQVVPVPRRDAGRGVPAADGDAGREAQGRTVLRPVLPRLGDPGDAGPAAAGVPGPHVQRRGLQAPWPDRRPCLLGDIDKCSAPCVGRVSAAEHRDRGGLLRLHGRAQRPDAAPSNGDEGAGRARVRAGGPAARRSGRGAPGHREAVRGFTDGTDADVVAFAEDPFEAAVQVFHVRAGRVRGQRGWVVEKTEDCPQGPRAPFLHPGLRRRGRGEGRGDLPREVLVPELPPDAEALPTG